MKIYDMISICLRNLWRRKGRTMLTVVGVVIGSCAVIVMISLGLGMSAAMDSMLSSWGDLTSITVYSSESGYGSDNDSKTDKPRVDDTAVELFRDIPNVETVIPKLSIGSDMIVITSGRNDRYKLGYASVYGVDFSFFEKMGYEVDQGILPDEHNKKDVLVMGIEVPYQFVDTKKHGNAMYAEKKELPDGSVTPPFIDPVDDKFKISIINNKKTNDDGSRQVGGKGYEFELDGSAVLKQDVNWDTPYAIFIDIDFAKDIIASYNRMNGVKNAKEPEYAQVKIMCKDLESVAAIQDEITALGYNATSMAQIREQMQGELGVIELILGGLAAISLLVAAISITNTMIMSIYERTKEIGIMKVLGCFIGNIRLLFLMEAGMIGLLGGIIGTLISYGLSFAMNTFGGSMFAEMLGTGAGGDGRVSIIPLWLVLLALVFSTVIGLISGFYPANRAVKISALEAIRNE
ncbi:MAG: ABC transporter permease [Ruminiclostridium sp.]|nr:ABC transporter permease [Ruminiclostridium sp.]